MPEEKWAEKHRSLGAAQLTRRRLLAAGGGAAATLAVGPPALGANSSRFWGFGASLAAAERTHAYDAQGRPIVDIVNATERRGAEKLNVECLAHWLDPTAEVEHWDQRAEPARLLIRDPEFAPDYMFTHGVELASERLREAMALGPQTVHWRPVALAAPSPAVMRQDYRQMHLRRMLDIVDGARTAFDTHEMRCGQSPGRMLELKLAKSIYWREDFDSAHALFRARHTNLSVASDALATRVLEAGIRDVAFLDYPRMSAAYERDGKAGPLLFKTL